MLLAIPPPDPGNKKFTNTSKSIDHTQIRKYKIPWPRRGGGAAAVAKPGGPGGGPPSGRAPRRPGPPRPKAGWKVLKNVVLLRWSVERRRHQKGLPRRYSSRSNNSRAHNIDTGREEFRAVSSTRPGPPGLPLPSQSNSTRPETTGTQ